MREASCMAEENQAIQLRRLNVRHSFEAAGDCRRMCSWDGFFEVQGSDWKKYERVDLQ